MSKPLNEIMFGMFYDLAKVIGVNLNPDQNEKLRIKTDQLGKKFEQMIKDTTISVGQQLQKATVKGFTTAGEEIDKVDDKVKELEECISFLQEQLTEMSETFSNVLQTVRDGQESAQTGSSVRGASGRSQTRSVPTKPARVESVTSPDSTLNSGLLQDAPFSSPDPTKTTSGSNTEPNEEA